jgi:hypothetical protein
VVHGWWFILH